eukprot:sb/3479061/
MNNRIIYTCQATSESPNDSNLLSLLNGCVKWFCRLSIFQPYKMSYHQVQMEGLARMSIMGDCGMWGDTARACCCLFLCCVLLRYLVVFSDLLLEPP